MLANLEILAATDAGAPSALFDATAEQLAALHYAVSHHLRWRFAGQGLEVDDTLAMRLVVGLADQLAALVEGAGHGTVLLAGSAGSLLHEAVATYLTMRDLESHQSVEERGRLAVLRPMVDDLRELCAALDDARGSDQPLCAA